MVVFLVNLNDFIKVKSKEALSLGKEEAAVIIYLEYLTKKSSSELYAMLFEELDSNIIKDFDEGFKEYLYHNKPIQYMVGYQTFYGYDFMVDERVLIPRFETEELVENVLLLYDEYFSGQEVNVCDIGTGSGAIGISLAKEEPHMNVFMTDISDDALDVARFNARKLGATVKIIKGDMAEPLLALNMQFDIIVSNPPYIPLHEEVLSLVKDNEPHIALFGGDDGLYFYRKILACAPKLLKKRGIIAFEHGYNKNAEIEALIKTYFKEAMVIHKKDLQGRDRMSFAIVGDFDAK